MNETSVLSKASLLARTLTMLSETVDRYELFADQMDVVNNPEAADLFRWLAEKQNNRTQVVESLSKDTELPHISPWDYNWDDAINTSAHYMMTPYHTLSLAIAVEQSAAKLFLQIEQSDVPSDVQKMARGFAREANDFCAQLEKKRKEYPVPEKGWDEDHDPPLMLE